MNTKSCPIKVNINKIELTVHTSFYCVLLCVIHNPLHSNMDILISGLGCVCSPCI